jgi:hypothetical protein
LSKAPPPTLKDDLSAIEKFLASLLADFGGGGGGSEVNFITETLMFVFAAPGTLTWRAQYDGWIAGWNHSKNTGVGISINVDLPATVLTSQSVYAGYVLGPQNDSFAASNVVQPAGRWPFKLNDLINVRPLGAGSTTVWLVLGRLVV